MNDTFIPLGDADARVVRGMTEKQYIPIRRADNSRFSGSLPLSDQEHVIRALDRIERYSIPEPNSGCWLWIGVVTANDYGVSSFKGVNVLAHRLSYFIHVCEIDNGLQLDHLCRVRCCVNPHHLEPVTIAENLRRGTGQHPHSFCRNGHPMTDNNVFYDNNKTKKGRRCAICRRERRNVVA